jgi:hypothetical protein
MGEYEGLWKAFKQVLKEYNDEHEPLTSKQILYLMNLVEGRSRFKTLFNEMMVEHDVDIRM